MRKVSTTLSLLVPQGTLLHKTGFMLNLNPLAEQQDQRVLAGPGWAPLRLIKVPSSGCCSQGPQRDNNEKGGHGLGWRERRALVLMQTNWKSLWGEKIILKKQSSPPSSEGLLSLTVQIPRASPAQTLVWPQINWRINWWGEGITKKIVGLGPFLFHTESSQIWSV